MNQRTAQFGCRPAIGWMNDASPARAQSVPSGSDDAHIRQLIEVEPVARRRIGSTGDLTMRTMTRVRQVLGTLFAAGCFGLAIYALFRLVQGGSCASGGNYVSTRQCPPGTGWWAAELPLGIIGGLLFLGLGYVKSGRPEPTIATPMSLLAGGRPAGWPAHVAWPPAGLDRQYATVLRMPGAGPQDPLDRLERLRALRDADALTAAEYDEAKAKILSEM